MHRAIEREPALRDAAGGIRLLVQGIRVFSEKVGHVCVFGLNPCLIVVHPVARLAVGRLARATDILDEVNWPAERT